MLSKGVVLWVGYLSVSELLKLIPQKQNRAKALTAIIWYQGEEGFSGPFHGSELFFQGVNSCKDDAQEMWWQ